MNPFGFRIVVSPNWPQVPDGETVHRSPAHPFVHWLARWFDFDPYVEFRTPQFRDADPMVDQAAGVIYCSATQERTIRRQMGVLATGLSVDRQFPIVAPQHPLGILRGGIYA
ncbi:hypothetical protein [Azospirillum sp. TSO5]|uniref:hypothetical protein n=1 Tax=Azospirillum sp. TSO5 TaxID=716760 RepID=UPI000D611022|nr:hypothetical protein [Azospirillum sp. TSO5]PWC98047.1 hypothetical protein TSO5_03330 [Azospirillum sp. TSO5]